jgi:hypothetical protein
MNKRHLQGLLPLEILGNNYNARYVGSQRIKLPCVHLSHSSKDSDHTVIAAAS